MPTSTTTAPSRTWSGPIMPARDFFPSLPEASVPRDSVNIDALWRVSDSVSLSADTQYNINENEWATAGAGKA